MAIGLLKDYLYNNRAGFIMIGYEKAFTAQEIAAHSHLTGFAFAKTVMVKIDGELAMSVLPAAERIDFDLLTEATGAKSVELAVEEEFANCFGECEVGAMPPFGNLFGMQVYVDPELALEELIGFNAGSHGELVQLRYRDFERLVQPVMLEFRVLA